ncbi:MAG: O-antigen ligase family protein [Variovorax sp.]
MSEHHRALVVLLLIGLAVYRLAGCLQAEQLPRAHVLRRGLWFALTIAAFALGDFWMFVVLAVSLLLWGRGREQNVPALFLALLFVVPPAQHDIPGMGLVNFFFGLNWPRLLALVLLLPLLPRLFGERHGSSGTLPRLADRLFLGYLFVQILLLGREASVTSALRSVFYLFVDVALPYFVFSRAFDTIPKLRDTVAALVVAGLLLAAVGVFEAGRHWLLYGALTQAWGSVDQFMYLGRSGVLRAMGSTGHAIALGYVLAICLCLYLPMHARLRAGWQRRALLLLFAAGLFSPLSRGPWLGALAGVLLYLALGERPVRNLLSFAAAGLFGFAVLSLLPFGRFVLELVPFTGTVETGNIEYRQLLMRNAAGLIWRHPVLGSTDYVERLAAMGMVQGQGIVDIVNSYVEVTLRSGLVGLALFAGLMAAALFSALRARRLSLRAGQDEAADLGRSLAAAQLAVIVTIGSVSSILVIPWMYWCLAGMLVGYARVVQACVRESRSPAGELRFA